MAIAESELILNPDGSVYHLNLRPEHIADTIITVGDPDRVHTVSKFFDSIEFKTQKREFCTHTGSYQGKRFTVISTGIGTDNIDIVLNELDALVNIDLEKREPKTQLRSLTIVRIGTSGSIQKNIPIDSFVASQHAIGFDSLLHYYQFDAYQDQAFATAVHQHINNPRFAKPYIANASEALLKSFCEDARVEPGITATNVGFYAPQGRILRANLVDADFMNKLASFSHQEKQITNLEMETSGIYGLARILGHRALSMNAIIANRTTGEFTTNGKALIDELIQLCLQKLIDIA